MNVKKLKNVALTTALALVGSGMVVAASVPAGGGGDITFTSAQDLLTNWMEGSLGRMIALAMVLVGLAVGIIRQSIIAVVVGIAGALALGNAPTIIEAVFTATL